MSPRASACAIIDSAGRSLTEPAGLLPSSLASSTLPVLPLMRCRRISGVLPTKPSSVGQDDAGAGARFADLLGLALIAQASIRHNGRRPAPPAGMGLYSRPYAVVRCRLA